MNEPQVNPEIEKAALSIAKDPLLFKKRIDVVNEAGIVGERKNVAMYFCAMDSRLLPENLLNPNVLAVKNAGHFGAGKSCTLKVCSEFYPEDAYFMITNGSAKSLYFLEGGLKHKALIVTEGFQFQENNAADSELVYSIRTLISEGRVSYCVVEKNDENKLVTVEKKLEGPTSFITTTIMENLEPQLEDRLFTIHPDEGVEQTKGIISMSALQKTGEFMGPDAVKYSTWKEFHKSLKPVMVVIPFASRLAEFITRSDIVPISTRRAFNRVLTVIQSVACAHQYQRKRDSKNNLVAEIADYWMALQIVSEAFRENMGLQDRKTEERLVIIEESGPITPKALAEKFGVAASAVSQWTKRKVKEGILTWCNENGDFFIDERELKKAKHTGTAYLKITDSYNPAKATGLPTPYELTGDADWNEGGKLLKLYDLELDKRSDKVFRGVKEVFIPGLNTSEESEPVDCIPEYADENAGVKVFIENEGEAEYLEGHVASNEEIKNIVDENPWKFDSMFEKAKGGNGSSTNIKLTPHVCQRGCVNYDPVKSPTNGELREYCLRNDKLIETGYLCRSFKGKEKVLPDGVLPM